MCGTLLSVRAHACVIAQCHGSDLVSRYRCAERTYGRQGQAAGGGTSVWGRTGAAGPGSEEGGSDRGISAICEQSSCFNEERSRSLWSDPKNLLRRRRNTAARRRRGQCAWKETNNAAG